MLPQVGLFLLVFLAPVYSRASLRIAARCGRKLLQNFCITSAHISSRTNTYTHTHTHVPRDRPRNRVGRVYIVFRKRRRSDRQDMSCADYFFEAFVRCNLVRGSALLYAAVYGQPLNAAKDKIMFAFSWYDGLYFELYRH